jgi:TRAP-type mannitol/chloroaromatic compound transport system permease large subunit
MKGVAPPEVRTKDIWRSVPPFLIMQIIVIILVMVFPQLAIWLPYNVF